MESRRSRGCHSYQARCCSNLFYSAQEPSAFNQFAEQQYDSPCRKERDDGRARYDQGLRDLKCIDEHVGRGNEEIMLRVDTKATGYEVCQDGSGTQPCGHMRRFVQT